MRGGASSGSGSGCRASPTRPTGGRTAVTGDGADAPTAALPAKLRRRSSLLIRMVAEVAAQASAEAGVLARAHPDRRRLRVRRARHDDRDAGRARGRRPAVADALPEQRAQQRRGPRCRSRTRNTQPATSLAAGNDTVAMVLLEAMTLLAARGGEVLAIVADEPLPQSLVPRTSGSGALAAALVLARGRRRAPGPRLRARGAGRSSPGADRHAAARGRSVEVDGPSAAILPLIAALARGPEARRAGASDASASPADGPALVDRRPRRASGPGTRVTSRFPPIVELVPHKPPMLLLDRVLSYEGDVRDAAKCESAPIAPFVEGRQVPGRGRDRVHGPGHRRLRRAVARARQGQRRPHRLPARLPRPDASRPTASRSAIG